MEIFIHIVQVIKPFITQLLSPSNYLEFEGLFVDMLT